MNTLAKILMGMTLTFITISCLYEKGGPVDPTVTGIVPTTDTTNLPASLDSLPCGKTVTTNAQNQVCFNTVILPLFLANCATSGCHDSKTAAEGYDLITYQKIVKKGIVAGNSKNSKLYNVMIITGEDRMSPAPSSPMSSDKTKLIAQWIDQGAKNIVCETSTTGTTAQTVSYSKHLVPVLDYYCTGCHNSNTKSGGINLTGYANVKQMAIDGVLYGSITHQIGYKPMPSTDVKLTDCQIGLFKQWIDLGMPNN
ncbi:hypothetical protein [Runella sp.]|jgi:hypothetical protein|uniref:hypothetical protein n=1 Tax=Runella sp. TaxID=1960881 RepID=UPI002638A6AB|nr:hypothetical protein [Runella sp.]